MGLVGICNKVLRWNSRQDLNHTQFTFRVMNPWLDLLLTFREIDFIDLNEGYINVI